MSAAESAIVTAVFGILLIIVIIMAYEKGQSSIGEQCAETGRFAYNDVLYSCTPMQAVQ